MPAEYKTRVLNLFERFRGHDSLLTPEDIWRFLAQAKIDNYIDKLIKMLECVDLLDRSKLEKLLMVCWNKLPNTIKNDGVFLNLGNPGDSTSIINNYLSHLRNTILVIYFELLRKTDINIVVRKHL